MSRISQDELYMRIVSDIAMRSTCRRRAVGALALDENGLVLATGFNGTPVGMPHCIDSPCAGATAPSGVALDMCDAVHAEQNLLLQVADVNKIHTIYCTTEPCTHCSKMIANTRCKRVVFEDPYPGSKHFGDIEYVQYSGIDTSSETGGGEVELTCENCDYLFDSIRCPYYGVVDSANSKACKKYKDEIPF